MQRNCSQGGRKVSLDLCFVPHVPHSSCHMARVTVQLSLSADSEGQAAAEELRSERYRSIFRRCLTRTASNQETIQSCNKILSVHCYHSQRNEHTIWMHKLDTASLFVCTPTCCRGFRPSFVPYGAQPEHNVHCYCQTMLCFSDWVPQRAVRGSERRKWLNH
jgi:hypothetical protein